MQSKAEFQRSNPKNSAFFYCYKDYYDIYFMDTDTEGNIVTDIISVNEDGTQKI